MKLVKLAIIGATAMIAASCSYFDATGTEYVRDKNYTQAKSIAPLRIPQGVSSSAFHNKYPVSDKHYTKAQMNVNLVPPGLYSKKN